MAVCEICLYRNNCQFLGKHKKAEVSACTALVSEIEFISKIKQESIKEFAETMKKKLQNVAKVEIMGCEYYPIGLSFIDNLVSGMFPKGSDTE